MRWLKSFFDFYLDASVHVALAAVSLYAVTIEILGAEPNHYLLTFIGFSSIVCYNFVKYGVEAEKYLIVSNSYHRTIQIFSFVCFLPVAYCVFFLDKEILSTIVALTLISAIYALPVLPQAKNLRSLGILKIFIVALVWTGFTVVLPLVDGGFSLSWDAFILGLQRFVLVLVLILPFEIRDLQYDDPNLGTVPQRIGQAKTKYLGYGLLLLFFGLTFLRDEIYTPEIISRFVIMVLAGLWLGMTRENQSKYFTSFWVESIPIFWCILLFVVS